jgi:hypothetical protein
MIWMLQSSIAWDKLAHSSNTVAQSVAQMTTCAPNKVVNSGKQHYIPEYYLIEVILEKCFCPFIYCNAISSNAFFWPCNLQNVEIIYSKTSFLVQIKFITEH